ncbi:AraC family transcriptional regulator [Phytohabitans rumicis]|uniref:AraC family transcriptional regulator n=1 Tax=Phytohabitans rumicis TaxID=1076125 RepID=UPI0031E75FDB
MEALHAHFERHVYHRHSHETYSFGVTEAGAQSFRCRGGAHTSSAGMVMAFNPDDPHDGHAADERGFTYRIVHIPPDLVRDLLADRAGRPVGLPLFDDPVVSDPVLGRAVSALHAALVGSGAGAVWTEERSDEGRRRLPGAGARASGASANWQSPATALARDERLAAAVAAMSSYAGPVAARPPRGKQAARRVRDMIDEGYARDLTADDLAAAAGTSRYAVYRAFREAYGLSPSDYQRQLRLRSARRMLVAGHGIAESAALAGFADQSHLTRWFLRCYGVTPGAYRQALDAPNRTK